MYQIWEVFSHYSFTYLFIPYSLIPVLWDFNNMYVGLFTSSNKCLRLCSFSLSSLCWIISIDRSLKEEDVKREVCIVHASVHMCYKRVVRKPFFCVWFQSRKKYYHLVEVIKRQILTCYKEIVVYWWSEWFFRLWIFQNQEYSMRCSKLLCLKVGIQNTYAVRNEELMWKSGADPGAPCEWLI